MSTTAPNVQQLPGWLKVSVLVVFSALALIALVVAFAPAEDAEPVPTVTAAAADARFAPVAIDAAKKALLAEPKIKDVYFDPTPLGVTWQIGVVGDGKLRFGYAEYVCLLLKDHKLVDKYTTVRIVDIEKVVASGGDFRAASLGQIDCSTGEHINP